MFVQCHVLKLESKESCSYSLKSFIIIEHFLGKNGSKGNCKQSRKKMGNLTLKILGWARLG